MVSWTHRYRRLAPVTRIDMELVRFDPQLMANPELRGVLYQQGTLFGYETREYLLEKFGRECAYCRKSDTPLQIEHVVPKSRGGSDRITNLTLACGDCNQKKGNLTAVEFGHPEVQSRCRAPLRDAAALNSTASRSPNGSRRTASMPLGRYPNRTSPASPTAASQDTYTIFVLSGCVTLIPFHLEPGVPQLRDVERRLREEHGAPPESYSGFSRRGRPHGAGHGSLRPI